MEKITLISNWVPIRRTRDRTVFLTLCVLLLTACIVSKNPENGEIKNDYLVPVYFSSNPLASRLYSIYLDSCKSAFNCSDLELIRLSISPSSDIWISNSHQSLVKESNQIALLKFPGGSFVVDYFDPAVNQLLGSFSEEGDTTIVMKRDLIVNQCLYDEDDNNDLLVHLAIDGQSIPGKLVVKSFYTVPK